MRGGLSFFSFIPAEASSFLMRLNTNTQSTSVVFGDGRTKYRATGHRPATPHNTEIKEVNSFVTGHGCV